MKNSDALRLFSDYLKVTGVAHTEPEATNQPALAGKRLGLLNGSTWVILWANYFGRVYLPGVHLVNAGNEAIQINFMQAHAAGLPTPPQVNIDKFVRYALDLVELAQVDAILITCSTMNRAYAQVQAALAGRGVPVVQIDRPMMDQAVRQGSHILVVSTHGPTVESTSQLLREVAQARHTSVQLSGEIVVDAWQSLARGDVVRHNELLAQSIRRRQEMEEIDCAVLAQLSMTVFVLSYPDPTKEFGIPIFTSGQCGYEYVRTLLEGLPPRVQGPAAPITMVEPS